jgi:hypothetical protein
MPEPKWRSPEATIRETTANQFRVEEDVLGASGREIETTPNKASER